jgi:cytochrome c peroxidase
MKRSVLPGGRRNKLGLVGLLILFQLPEPGRTLIAETQNWDPPAIDVFPDHAAAARSKIELSRMLSAGKRLFSMKFNVVDGAGRPAATGDSKPTIREAINNRGMLRTSGPDALSCAACHNDPAAGGSGDFVANVFVGAQFRDPPTTSIDFKDTSERNTIGLFGAGAIEMLAREMTQDLQQQRSEALVKARILGTDIEVRLVTKGVSFGSLVARPDGTFDARRVEGIDPDLVLKPFGAKGVVISLREFTTNALNQHSGMQTLERFGWERTGSRDFDEDGIRVELTEGQLSALTLFQASLRAPALSPSKKASNAAALQKGAMIFRGVGCAQCHIPELPLQATHFTEPNPYNRPGNLLPKDNLVIRMALSSGGKYAGIRRGSQGRLLVAAFTDLKRHKICDATDEFFGNEKLRQDNVPTDQFLTSKLWDLYTSAPYGHRGDCTTLSEAILHHAGEGLSSRNQFSKLADSDKKMLILFLRSLGAGSAQENK